jgi:hypothetical protein
MLQRREITTSEEETFIHLWSSTIPSDEEMYFADLYGSESFDLTSDELPQLEEFRNFVVKGYMLSIKWDYSTLDPPLHMLAKCFCRLYRVKDSNFTLIDSFNHDSYSIREIRKLLIDKGGEYRHIALTQMNCYSDNNIYQGKGFTYVIISEERVTVLR